MTKYTFQDGAIVGDGVPLLCFVRRVWGDGAPPQAELNAAEKYVAALLNAQHFVPDYSPWRHGGWYTNVKYPSGACGCVSRNYPDKKWRIACDPRPNPPTFACRDDAARAEYILANS